MLTSDLHLVVYDHNLRVLWSRTLAPMIPRGYVIAESGGVALLVDPATGSSARRGLVVVAFELDADRGLGAPTALLDGAGLFLAFDGHDGAAVWRHDSKGLHDPEEEMRRIDEVGLGRWAKGVARERQRGHHGSDASSTDGSSTDGSTRLPMGALGDTMLSEHRFNDPGRPEEARTASSDALHASTHAERAGSCRDHRAAVLGLLPHVWTGPWDLALQTARFAPVPAAKAARGAAGRGRGASGPASASSAPGGPGSLNIFSPLYSRGSAPAPFSGSGAQAAGAAAAPPPPDVLIARRRSGLEAVHLHSGRAVCRVALPAPGLHADVDADGVPDRLVVRGRRPGELVFGADLGLPTGASEASGATQAHAAPTPPYRPLPGSARLLSGVPARKLRWTSTAASSTAASVGASTSSSVAAPLRAEWLAFAPPIAQPILDAHGGRGRGRALAVAYSSRGELTAFEPDGTVAWRRADAPRFDPAAEAWVADGWFDESLGGLRRVDPVAGDPGRRAERGAGRTGLEGQSDEHHADVRPFGGDFRAEGRGAGTGAAVEEHPAPPRGSGFGSAADPAIPPPTAWHAELPPPPTLLALALRPGAAPTVTLAAGEAEAAVVSPSGEELARLSLPFAPTHPLLAADADGDGLNDLLVVGKEGIAAFGQRRAGEGLPFSALVGTLVIVLVLVFASQGGFGVRRAVGEGADDDEEEEEEEEEEGGEEREEEREEEEGEEERRRRFPAAGPLHAARGEAHEQQGPSAGEFGGYGGGVGVRSGTIGGTLGAATRLGGPGIPNAPVPSVPSLSSFATAPAYGAPTDPSRGSGAPQFSRGPLPGSLASFTSAASSFSDLSAPPSRPASSRPSFAAAPPAAAPGSRSATAWPTFSETPQGSASATPRSARPRAALASAVPGQATGGPRPQRSTGGRPRAD